jgi:uncharacterized protein (DUF608 family)
MKTRDTNHNGLPDWGNTTYDTWGLSGDNLLCGALWIGALEAMEQLAAAKGDSVLSRHFRQECDSAKPVLDTLLWKPELQYYKIDVSSDAIMADGLNGQRYCETTGLDPVLPPERIASHLNQVFERCVQPLRDYDGDGVGDVGVVNGRNSNGGSIGWGQPNEVWTGSSYFVAAMMYHWGNQMNDERLKERALKTAYGVYYQTWVNENTAYFFNTPEAWSSTNPAQYRAQQYQRPRAVWELLLEIKNPFNALTSVAAGHPARVPVSCTLSQNFPNPFNPSTNISFSLPKQLQVSLRIYDLLGRELAKIVDERKDPGSYTVEWNARNFSSGVYFYRLQAGEFIKTKRLLLLR